MKRFSTRLAGDAIFVHFPEHPEDLREFDSFLARSPILGFDTEATGLDMYSLDYQLRLVQFGNAYEAWVLRADLFREEIIRVLRSGRPMVAHNATFDALVVDRHLGVSLEDLLPHVEDTRIAAHLLDPRPAEHGGVGLALKPLTALYVDQRAPDTSEGLTAVFRSLKLTKATGFAQVPIDHPMYVLYAGLDAVLVHRLHAKLTPRVGWHHLVGLSELEHRLQAHLATVMRRGMRLDVRYVEVLLHELLAETATAERVAGEHGITAVNSTAQVADALVAMGERLLATTPTGKLKVDHAILSGLADLDGQGERINVREPNPAAEAVIVAKRGRKWATTYARAFLDLRDEHDRLHPSIGTLQARTARMSVSRPPLQQLPASEWRIRRCFIPDPGQVLIAADYATVEMRVLAALANEPMMRRVIAGGLDLHDFTAERVFGEGFTKAQRKIAKTIGFAKVYGGGAATIARQSGAELAAIERAISAYDQTFPGIRRYSYDLIATARTQGAVFTPSGRRLPVDAHRLYCATNYIVQSASRDVFARAILDIFDAGLGGHVLLPVHDELILQAPAADAQDVAKAIGELMHTTFHGVELASNTSIYGPSWGHGYGAPDMASTKESR